MPNDARRDARLDILRGAHDDAVLARAYALGWRPSIDAELRELARRADEDLDKLLADLSAGPLPLQPTDEDQE